MTEDEAKTKWCPHARAGSGQSGLGSMNREAFPTPADPNLVERNTRCIASACMAWRWFETHVRNDQLAEPHPGIPPGELVRSTRTYGCCGLAGPWFGPLETGRK